VQYGAGVVGRTTVTENIEFAVAVNVFIEVGNTGISRTVTV
jgi:hypothetical protein